MPGGCGGLCAENADVDVEDAIGVPGEVDLELGDEGAGSKEAIDESRNLDGILDCDPVWGSWYDYRKSY